MSQVWCTRAAGVAAALLLSGPWSAAGLATGSPGAGRVAAPPGLPLARAADAGAVPPEPVPAAALVRVAASPVLVPPEAPVDLAVDAPVLVGRRVDLQIATGDEWVTVGTVTLDGQGHGTVRVRRTVAGRYDVRAVSELAPGVRVRSAVASFSVTTTGLGDPRAYRYMYVRRGAPARWNPCAVVTYRVRGGTPARLADVREALRRVTYETGVRFRELGATAQVPGSRGFRYDADLVVAWARPDDTTLLGGERAAAGGFEGPVAGRGGRPRIRNGFVVVDETKVDEMDPGFGAGATQGQVLLHELGHAMGLDHVTAAHQMMRPEVDNHAVAALYGAGDLTGLRRIGRAAGCL